MTTYLILALTVIIATSVVDIFRAHQKVSELEDQLENEISLRRDIKLSAIRYQRLLELAEAEVHDLKIRLDESHRTRECPYSNTELAMATADQTLPLLTSLELRTVLGDRAQGSDVLVHLTVELSRLVRRPDFDPWPLVFALGRAGDLLPKHLRDSLAKHLPKSPGDAVQALSEARRKLGISSTGQPLEDAQALATALDAVNQFRKGETDATTCVERLETAAPGLPRADQKDRGRFYQAFDLIRDRSRDIALAKRMFQIIRHIDPEEQGSLLANTREGARRRLYLFLRP